MKKFKWIICLMLLVILPTVINAGAVRVFTLQQAVADPNIKITLKSKPGGGYFGDDVTIVVKNNYSEDIQVTARVGDVLLDKDKSDQNLVVIKRLVLRVPAGQTRQADGIWTACIDAHQSPPDGGDLFDVTDNVRDWTIDSAQMLYRLLEIIDERELYADDDAQDAIWKITDNDPPGSGARELLEAAGIDPDQDITDFPHPETPYSGTSETESVSASEMGIRTGPHRGKVTVTLTWDSTADLDLHVIDPYGEEIYYDHPTSESGGMLDYDDRCDDHGPDGQPGGPENIYWDNPPEETYTVEINYYEECQGEGTTHWWVRILIDGHEENFDGTISPEDGTILVTTFEYPG